MLKYWKRFEALVTELKSDQFKRALVKLSIVYTIIIVSAVIFYLILLNREFERYTIFFANKIFRDQTVKEKFITKSLTISRSTLFSVYPEDIFMFFILTAISIFFADQALRPLKRNAMIQKRFLADASHELRTPLTIVKTEMEVFLRDDGKWVRNKALLPRKNELIKSNIEELDKMDQILDELLLITRLDLQAYKMNKTIFDGSVLLRQVIKRLKTPSSEKKIAIRIVYLEPKILFIEGDLRKIEQAFMNIIRNAINYTDDRGEVVITISREKHYAKFVIEDTGIGIKPSDFSHVFEPFYRGDTGRLKSSEGSGLGLTIAKAIINRHSGTIDIQSVNGKGTKFTVMLPLFEKTDRG